MTARLWIKSTALSLIVALVSSCSLQRVNESASRAENDAATASQYSRFLRNQQQESARATVVFSDKPWVSKTAGRQAWFTADHGLRHHLSPLI